MENLWINIFLVSLIVKLLLVHLWGLYCIFYDTDKKQP
jgi:hypothetical protein